MSEHLTETETHEPCLGGGACSCGFDAGCGTTAFEALVEHLVSVRVDAIVARHRTEAAEDARGAMDHFKLRWQTEAAADERARIVWWLRTGITGPAAMSCTEEYLNALADLADVIEQHPERFADAPTGQGAES